MSSTRNPKILLVGAYERDNFGDLLFYRLTADYFGGAEVAAGSIIGSDMSSLLGTLVHPYNDLLAARSWDLVWVVGGEVGGVDTGGALAMSLDETDGAVFDGAGSVGRNVIARYLSGASVQSPAYLPSLKDFPLNERTPMVLHSVGLGNMLPEGSTVGGDLAIGAVRGATFVGVRDAVSHNFASAIGKPAELSPDMVHAISIRHPELATPTTASDPYFIFQSNAHLIREFGAEAIALALARVTAATHWRPAFFLAGTARHHDHSDQYDGIRLALKAIDPTIVPKIFTSRSPMDLASYIAGSQLWIGSSLHGRIIAGSFSRPRVSLENVKVAAYASTWDAGFPANVSFDRVPDSVVEAVTAAHLPTSIAASREIAHLADRTTASLVRRFQ